MLDQLWSSWGASVIGPLHVKSGVANQDSWMARRYKWGNVVVVSDGLGSKKHSDHGSKAACLAVFEAAKSYQNTPDANITDILRMIHANWLVKIAPYSSSDCSATCLFCIQIENMITLGRLGDGMIAALGETDGSYLILSDNKQDSFSNFTNSLQQEFKPEQWEIETIESAACNAVVLCTDGISDDLLPEKQMSFAQELYSSYADLKSAERMKDLKRWLKAWPVPGHSDDKTIACLCKKRVNI
ncbi:PP2C family serine/threonine-protein phosphatase [Lentisphaera marina]|uniref:PP2C family serine/threonine-protein phosphatase n=1 Tax=Lentisphaera marina TaxID=1111041 RepID=UPI0023656622|nr:PP2C family serine/threonine-protein phosphatase [Lentisphaera marina]MDD7984710.1 PP2C family serine/threonine-protein phosphatase [Lentisphaera marina]